MSFKLEAVRDSPQGLWMLDDSSPFQDYSGLSQNATATGTENKHSPLTKGAVYAQIFSSSAIGSFTCPVFNQGSESKPFTLESWIRPIARTTGQKALPYYENLVTNPSLETGTTGWAPQWFGPGGAGTDTRSASAALVGGFGWRRTWTTGASGADIGVNISLVPVTAGKAYSFGMYSRSSKAMTLSPRIYWRDSGGALVGSMVFGPRVDMLTPNTWTRATMENFVAPAGAVTATFNTGPYSQGTIPTMVAGDTFDVDAGMVVQGPTLPQYFDGGYPGYEWAGTANASISRTVSNVARFNMLANPSLESPGTGWSVYGAQSPTVTYPSGGLFGNNYASVTVSGVTSDNGLQTFLGQGAVLKGQTYTFSAYLRNPGATPLSLRMRTQSSSSGAAIVPADNQWHRYSFTFVAGDTMTFWRPAEFWSGGSTSGTVHIDGVLLEPGSTVGDFFSGDSPGAGWSGAPYSTYSYMYVSNAEQQILGNQNQMDGLTINGTVLSFVTKYATTGEARATYDIQQLRNVLVHGVHTEAKNSLFVNGLLVDEVVINEDQKADTFVTTTSSLYSGATTSSQQLAIQGVAVYPQALPSASIISHYREGRDAVSAPEVAVAFSGNRIPLSYDSTDIFLSKTWESFDDWNRGMRQNTVVSSDVLLPQFADGVSGPSTWTDSFPIGTAPDASIYGVNMYWDGVGITVSSSLDGVNWTQVAQGENLASIPPGFDPTNKLLHVRVSFAGGVLDDPAYLNSLTVVGIDNGSVLEWDRTISTTGAAYRHPEYNVTELHDDWGTELAGGTLTISTSATEDPENPQTVELWVKKTSGTLTTNLTTPTAYKSGVAVASLDAAAPVGQWSLVHLTVPAAVTGSITFTGNAEIGQIVLYGSVLTTAQMAQIERSYLGIPAITVADSGLVNVAQSGAAATIYAHDWSVSTAA